MPRDVEVCVGLLSKQEVGTQADTGLGVGDTFWKPVGGPIRVNCQPGPASMCRRAVTRDGRAPSRMWPPDPRCLTLCHSAHAVLRCLALSFLVLRRPLMPRAVLPTFWATGLVVSAGPAGDAPPPPQARPQRLRSPPRGALGPPTRPADRGRENPPQGCKRRKPRARHGAAFGSGRNRGRGRAACTIQRKIQGKECPEPGSGLPDSAEQGRPGRSRPKTRPSGDKDCFPGEGPSDASGPHASTLTAHRPFKRLEAGIGCAAEVGR